MRVMSIKCQATCSAEEQLGLPGVLSAPSVGVVLRLTAGRAVPGTVVGATGTQGTCGVAHCNVLVSSIPVIP